MTDFLFRLGLCLGLPFLVGWLIANNGGMTGIARLWKRIWEDDEEKRDA